MSTAMTIQVPDHVVEQAREIAEKTQAPIEQVLVDAWEETFPQPSVHPQREQMLQEVAAFEAMHSQLVDDYLNKYVAIYQGQVVDSDQDVDALMQRRVEKFAGKVVLIEKVEPHLPAIPHVRSPRLL